MLFTQICLNRLKASHLKYTDSILCMIFFSLTKLIQGQSEKNIRSMGGKGYEDNDKEVHIFKDKGLEMLATRIKENWTFMTKSYKVLIGAKMRDDRPNNIQVGYRIPHLTCNIHNNHLIHEKRNSYDLNMLKCTLFLCKNIFFHYWQHLIFTTEITDKYSVRLIRWPRRQPIPYFPQSKPHW